MSQAETLYRRQIGSIGTIARILLGLASLVVGVLGYKVIVTNGHVETGFSPVSLALGLVAFPAVVLAWQWLRARRTATPLQATGPVATAINMLVLFALLLTPLYAQPFSFTSSAALVFYGVSMLLAAVQGYSGCEVLAVSNWLLGRNDQVGCLVLSPIDNIERSLSR